MVVLGEHELKLGSNFRLELELGFFFTFFFANIVELFLMSIIVWQCKMILRSSLISILALSLSSNFL